MSCNFTELKLKEEFQISYIILQRLKIYFYYSSNVLQ